MALCGSLRAFPLNLNLHYNAPSEVIHGPPAWVRAITLFRVSRHKLFLSSHKDYLRGRATLRE
jgi:hypothetical protein